MKKCPECSSSSFTIGGMFKAHFFGQRLYCNVCKTEFEFGKVNFLVDTLIDNWVVTVLPIVVLIFGIVTLNFLVALIGGSVVILVYWLHIKLSPLKSVGLRAELKKRGL